MSVTLHGRMKCENNGQRKALPNTTQTFQGMHTKVGWSLLITQRLFFVRKLSPTYHTPITHSLLPSPPSNIYTAPVHVHLSPLSPSNTHAMLAYIHNICICTCTQPMYIHQHAHTVQLYTFVHTLSWVSL